MNQLAANTGATGSSIIERIENDIHRMRRTIHLLISVGMVFCICWLPLNILNTVSESIQPQNKAITITLTIQKQKSFPFFLNLCDNLIISRFHHSSTSTGNHNNH